MYIGKIDSKINTFNYVTYVYFNFVNNMFIVYICYMKNIFPKILVACPTADAKNYTALEWMQNTQLFNYPNYDVVVFDNTDDSGLNTDYLNNLAKDNGILNYEAIHYSNNKHENLIERMCISHNLCRDYAINNGYSYLFHLESDVICPIDALQNLYIANKKVTGGLYYIDSGKSRRLMAQTRIYKSSNNIVSENFLPTEDVFFIDGSIKQNAHIGLGCVLINVNVLRKIPFRFDANLNLHSDSFFAEDCYRNKIKIFADTNIICKHNNENWGVHGLNWK